MALVKKKLEEFEETDSIVDGFSYIILPDPENPGKFIPFKFKPEDFGGGGNWGDIEGTLVDQTDLVLYIDNKIAGLLDYRGGYDASVDTFPSTGGSGAEGAILKGDTWVISVAGSLGGSSIQVGDIIIANIDTPGQTAANWDKLNTNVSYVPEDSANKENSTIDTSITKYPTINLLKIGLDTKLDVTLVGTGQTYTTLGGAVTAGKKLIEIISNTTETGDIALAAGTIIFSKAGRDTYSVGMGAYKFTSATGCKFDGFTLSYTHSGSSSPLFSPTYTEGSGTEQPVFTNMAFINSSTITDCPISYYGKFYNCIVTLPAYAYGGFGISTSQFLGELEEIEFVANSTETSYIIFNTTTKRIFRNLYLRGTFNTSNTMAVTGIDGLRTDSNIYINAYGNLHNCVTNTPNGSSLISVDFRVDYYIIVSDSILRGEVDGNSGTARRVKFVNCHFSYNFSLSTNEDSFSFVNCKFLGTVSVSIPNIVFSSCWFQGAVTLGNLRCILEACQVYRTLVVSGDNNIINSNIVGIEQTGSQTITFNSGADNNICIGNQTDIAIVNNGAGNQLAYNVVF